MKPIPLVRKVALAPAISYLADQGVPVSRYLHRAKLTPPTPETHETLIPLHQASVFLNSVARAEGLDDLGFHIAGHLGIQSLGSYGRLLAKAFTFHEAFQITRELISSYNSGLTVWLEYRDDQVRYCQKYTGDLPQNRTTEIVHLGLANTVALLGVHRGADFQPIRVELATAAIDLGMYIPELASLPITFNQPQTSLWFDRTWLSKPLPAFGARHCPPAYDSERASFMSTGPSTEAIDQLEQVIESVLDQPAINLQFTASIIGTSPRTLQRRLAEEDQSFSRLLQSLRFRKAQRLLHDRTMPLMEIARCLGYADSANFIRAFKRWTGVGPNEFRRLHFGNEHGRVHA